MDIYGERMSDVLVTVIVPVYNAQNYLDRCLESILNQTYRPLEVILIDDGSVDDSAILCDRFARSCDDRQIEIVVIHQKNKGPSAARNAGMAYANGDYFVCIDCDDTVSPDYVKWLADTQKAHPEIGHVWCGYQIVENDTVIRKEVFSDQEDMTSLSREQYMLLLSKGFAQSPWLHLYKTDEVQMKNITMPTDISLGEDFLFNLRYMDSVSNTSILIINEPLYNYAFVNENSLAKKFRPDLFQINKRLVETTKHYLEKWNASEESWQMYWNWAYVYYEGAIENYRRKDIGNDPKTQTKLINEILKDKGYQQTLRKRNTYLNAMIYVAYRSKSFFVVRVVEKLAQIKSMVMRKT